MDSIGVNGLTIDYYRPALTDIRVIVYDSEQRENKLFSKCFKGINLPDAIFKAQEIVLKKWPWKLVTKDFRRR